MPFTTQLAPNPQPLAASIPSLVRPHTQRSSQSTNMPPRIPRGASKPAEVTSRRTESRTEETKQEPRVLMLDVRYTTRDGGEGLIRFRIRGTSRLRRVRRAFENARNLEEGSVSLYYQRDVGEDGPLLPVAPTDTPDGLDMEDGATMYALVEAANLGGE